MKQIKMTIVVSEVGHPHLFCLLEKMTQPRARALLFKRLAEERARAPDGLGQPSANYNEKAVHSGPSPSIGGFEQNTDDGLAEWFR